MRKWRVSGFEKFLIFYLPRRDGIAILSLNVLDRVKAGEEALVPSFWSLEVLNILLLGERKGRITAQQTKAFLDTLRVLNPRMDFASLQQVAGPVQIICRDHRLTPYDALYIELALRSGFPLPRWISPKERRPWLLAFPVYEHRTYLFPCRPDVSRKSLRADAEGRLSRNPVKTECGGRPSQQPPHVIC